MKAAAYTILTFALISAYIVVAASLLTPSGSAPSVRPRAPLSAPARPVPCFFLGNPDVRDKRACEEFGGEKRVRWDVYCQPDPNCTKLPDGTDYARP